MNINVRKNINILFTSKELLSPIWASMGTSISLKIHQFKKKKNEIIKHLEISNKKSSYESIFCIIWHCQ